MKWLARLRSWGVFLTFLAAGAILITTYVRLEPFNRRTHDIGSNLAYIAVVQKFHRVPTPKDCWMCHQPPAYFVAAAWLLDRTHSKLPSEYDSDNVQRGERVLRGLGAVIALGTLAFWLLTARALLSTTYEQVLASALLAFWPTLTIDGTQINADGLVTLLVSGSVCLLVLWRRRLRPWLLVGAAVFAGLAVQAKSNGAVAIAIVVCSIGVAILRKPPDEPRWPRGATAATLALCVLIGAWAFVVQHWKQGQYGANNADGIGSPVATGLQQLFGLTLATFWKTPFCYWNGPGSDEFWNFFFRSALFGEYATDDATMRTCGFWLVLVTACLLVMLALGLLACLVRGLRRDDAGHREMVIALLGLVLSVFALRVKYPYLPSSEFRYCLSAAAPAAVLVALGSGALRRKLARRWPHWAALPGWLVAAFCALSTQILLAWH